MSKYNDNQRIPLLGNRVLVIDGVMIQCVLLDSGADYEPYTYYNYHIETDKGELLEQDFSVPYTKIDEIVQKYGI